MTLTFRSLGQVESTAMAIAAGDFSQRMTDIEPTTTEVGRLKTAINTMLGRVDFAISQRDAIGAADAPVHRRRQPRAAHAARDGARIRRAVPDGRDLAATRMSRQAMDRIEKEAMRMGVLVEDLLALARLDERRDVVIGPVDLRPIARDAALDVRATSPLRPVTVIDTTARRTVPHPAPASGRCDARPEQERAPARRTSDICDRPRGRRRAVAAAAQTAPGLGG